MLEIHATAKERRFFIILDSALAALFCANRKVFVNGAGRRLKAAARVRGLIGTVTLLLMWGETSRGIEATCEPVSELASGIEALSHRLHSSKLEYLGLEAASSSFCRELAERRSVKIDFQCEGIPKELSGEASLCLFRVLQEALHNAVKHSGVDKFEVSPIGRAHEIQLRVHDSGAGFDPTLASNGRGLGLTSMKERLRLLNGECAIDTTILARIPVAAAA